MCLCSVCVCVCEDFWYSCENSLLPKVFKYLGGYVHSNVLWCLLSLSRMEVADMEDHASSDGGPTQQFYLLIAGADLASRRARAAGADVPSKPGVSNIFARFVLCEIHGKVEACEYQGYNVANFLKLAKRSKLSEVSAR